jgi:hypothetical protein
MATVSDKDLRLSDSWPVYALEMQREAARLRAAGLPQLAAGVLAGLVEHVDEVIRIRKEMASLRALP